MKKKIRRALFPGSYDPVTCGHIEIVKRALPLFDEIVVAIGRNPQKETMFSEETRYRWLQKAFAEFPNVKVAKYDMLTVYFAKQIQANFLLRGLRNSKDLEYEKYIDYINHHLESSIETVYLLSSPQTAHISSTLVRDIIQYKGKLRGLLPDFIIREIYQ